MNDERHPDSTAEPGSQTPPESSISRRGESPDSPEGKGTPPSESTGKTKEESASSFIPHPSSLHSRPPFRRALRFVRALIGFTVLFLGILLLVLPGPAIVVIPVGLAILATEYAWARRYLNKFKEGGEKLGMIFFRRKKPRNHENISPKN